MIRRTTNNALAGATGTINQENTTFRQKHGDQATAPVARPPMRFALGAIQNTQQNAATKRTGSLKFVKDEVAVPVSKVESRRPLRSNSSLAAKNAESKVTRAVAAKNATSSSENSVSTLASSSSTTLSGIDSSVAASIKTVVPAKAGVAIGRGRLLRSNAVSSLHAAAASVGADGSALQSETAELVTLQAALCLAPVKEEPETGTSHSPNRDNAYSSSMMPNIDQADADNPQFVADYVNDIYSYLRALELQQPIKENFLDGKEVTGRMRSILVDWLSQVHVRFHLLPETMYMTVGMIDRFLQEVAVPKEKLQLVGVTAMFVASKYEEMYAPEIGDFMYITDHSCSKQDIRVMECMLLRTLGFKLGRPLPIHFLRRYSKAADADATVHTLAKYFLELALCQYPLAHYHPSIMAAAALWLSLKLLNPASEWSQTLIYYSKYNEQDFMPCLRRLCRAIVRTHTAEIKQQAVRNKFSTSKFMEISKHPCLNLTTLRKFGEC